MSEIRFRRFYHVDLHYHVLNHLNLGRDAASLYTAAVGDKPWVSQLLDSYQKSPERLMIQALPLLFSNLSKMLGALSKCRCRFSPDQIDEKLHQDLANALSSEDNTFRQCFLEGEKRETDLITKAGKKMLPRLLAYRQALWERLDRKPPILTVIHSPPLGLNGRATGGRGRHRVVAVSLREPLDYALCQIVHEETHPVSDFQIRKAHLGGDQDTKVGTPGHRFHLQLEKAAISLGFDVVEAAVPELLRSYRKWCRQHGFRTKSK